MPELGRWLNRDPIEMLGHMLVKKVNQVQIESLNDRIKSSLKQLLLNVPFDIFITQSEYIEALDILDMLDILPDELFVAVFGFDRVDSDRALLINIQSANLYNFNLNSPLLYVDPNGEAATIIAAIVTTVGLVAAAAYGGMKTLCAGLYQQDQIQRKTCKIIGEEYEEAASVARDFCKRLGWYKTANQYNPDI